MALFAVAVVIAVSGCGGGSSKPAYCTNRTNLENSVKQIPSLITNRDISQLQAQATKIESEATKLVSSAKSDFPSQTTAVKNNVDALSTAIKSLPSNPTASDLVEVGVKAASAVSAVSDFYNATKSKCA